MEKVEKKEYSGKIIIEVKDGQVQPIKVEGGKLPFRGLAQLVNMAIEKTVDTFEVG
jgi:hypothetical protein